jgi:hypothetical protein
MIKSSAIATIIPMNHGSVATFRTARAIFKKFKFKDKYI